MPSHLIQPIRRTELRRSRLIQRTLAVIVAMGLSTSIAALSAETATAASLPTVASADHIPIVLADRDATGVREPAQLAQEQSLRRTLTLAQRAAGSGDWRSYFRCILGIGVPAGIGWFFVGTVGSATLLTMAVNWASRPSVGPSPFGWAANWILRSYAKPVWDSCRAFVRS